jgi:hypothetical protein
MRCSWLHGLEMAAEDSSVLWRSPGPVAAGEMNTGGTGPARFRPLVHPLEYWNVWAKMAPDRQQRMSSAPEKVWTRHRESDTVLWKCIAAAVLMDLQIDGAALDGAFRDGKRW